MGPSACGSQPKRPRRRLRRHRKQRVCGSAEYGWIDARRNDGWCESRGMSFVVNGQKMIQNITFQNGSDYEVTTKSPRGRLGGSQRPRLPWTRSIVLSGADVGHDRVRDGTGWVHVALGHEPPGRSRGDRVQRGKGAQERAVVVRRSVTSLGGTRLSVHKSVPSSAMSTAQLRSVARRPPAASQPGHLPGALLVLRMGTLVLGRDSRLDAFSGSPVRTWLPSGAGYPTTGTPAVRPARSSRTRASPPQYPNARGG